ncbi:MULTISPECIES: DUF6320 domain-containing protein [unclassified Butyrivibrio]|uniref:DUF6320 domain-containing protein n=1 Tax=unclassified Butyrivibrio TaxID=2639466 RepID=UPI0008E3F5FE|nr:MULTISPECIES: DUF6320 domain-containing protein [unclassified Butyrivibrio]RKM56274.1 hypothetical protein D6853_05625 [Butyrivibrio sp. X503]SFU60333.1 hypothetical protein SAMN02910342_01097 [Butyrivibrio sp. INlla21]
MQICPKCKINIRGKKECCPLCQGQLKTVEGDNNPAFPTLKRKVMSHITFLKICTFLFATVEIVFATIDIMTGRQYSFFGPLMLGFLAGWVTILTTVYLRNNILKIITWEVIVAIVVDIYIDFKTGFHGWSVEWMVPMTLIGLAIVTIITAVSLKLRLDEYIYYIIFDFAMTLGQIYFIKKGYNKLPWPVGISIMCYLILIVGVVIFRFRDLKQASEKMFNM